MHFPQQLPGLLFRPDLLLQLLLQGQTLTALVEEVNEQDASLVTGRLSNNTIVHFPGSADLIGQIVPVKLEECHGFYYTGHRVEETK